MRFPPSFIERLRAHFLMSEVIGKRMPIKKHGREYHGLCPFHNEKTPSFTVNDEKGFFHCFGCGAHGDAIEFVRKFERLSYVETMESLAREAGIPLPEVSAEETRKAEVAKTLYDVMEAACQWYEKQLNSTSGAIAHDYVEKRGLKTDTLRTFRVGFAPDDRNALHQHLLKVGFSQALQMEAGLIIVPEQGGNPYDRFRGRIMFPIRNASGKVIAFGGRVMPGGPTNKNIPKYLNSPETPLFKKGEGLYNIDLAKKIARESNMTVVMEGYMDVVSTSQSGIGYAVATLGTAVTPEHLRLLWQLAREPIMCLDGDTAGQRAMMRAAEVALPLLKPGFSLRFAMLPKGEDPDTYVQKHGKASFEKILVTSKRLSQVLWETLSPQYNMSVPEGRAELENELKKLADAITDPTVRSHYSSYFRKLLWTKAPTPPKITQGKISQGKISQNKIPQERSRHVEQLVVQHQSTAVETLVQRLLTTIIQFPELLHRSNVEETLSRLDIRSKHLDTMRHALLSACAHIDVHDHAGFIVYLEKQTHTEMAGDKLKLPYSDNHTVHDALLLWTETLTVYQEEHLKFELKALEESMGKHMDEAALQRMIELQQAIRKAQSARTFAPAEVELN